MDGDVDLLMSLHDYNLLNLHHRSCALCGWLSYLSTPMISRILSKPMSSKTQETPRLWKSHRVRLGLKAYPDRPGALSVQLTLPGREVTP